MDNRFFKVDTATRFITNITVGTVNIDGFEAVRQTPDLLHVGIGWSYIDGEFSDTKAAYRTHLSTIRGVRTQGFLASIPEA